MKCQTASPFSSPCTLEPSRATLPPKTELNYPLIEYLILFWNDSNHVIKLVCLQELAIASEVQDCMHYTWVLFFLQEKGTVGIH